MADTIHGDKGAYVDVDHYFPPYAFYFSVEIDGFSGVQASFQEASGIDVEAETLPIKEAGENNYSYKVLGRSKYNNLVLKRGLFAYGGELQKWVTETVQSRLAQKVVPRDITVHLLDPGTTAPMVSWNFKNAYPVKWNLGKFNSQENSIAVETVEFAFTEWTFVPS